MEQFVTLSRAARLVGVSRGTLQKQIREGQLETFEGEVALADLLRLYPHTQVEDDTMLERMERIVERARTKARSRPVLPDRETLSARVALLGKELARAKSEMIRYKWLAHAMMRKLIELEQAGKAGADSPLGELKKWFDEALVADPEHAKIPEELLAKDTFLRIMAAQVHILPSHHEFFVQGNDSVLDAALGAGHAMVYGCSSGNCGKCKAKLVSGSIKKIQNHDYVITEAEKRQGYFLMCSNTAITDLVIDAYEAEGTKDIPVQHVSARLKKLQPTNGDVLILHVQTPRTNRLRFLAGQYASLQLTDNTVLELPIASCPCDERNLQFHVPASPQFTLGERLNGMMKNADVVGLEGPFGDFVLREESQRPIVFIAYDSGFAPIKSLVEHAMALDFAETLHLFWVASTKNGHYLDNLCRSWRDALDNFSYTPLDLDENRRREASALAEPADPNAAARVCETIVGQLRDLSNYDIYLAGPKAYAEVTRAALREHGAAADQLHVHHMPEWTRPNL